MFKPGNLRKPDGSFVEDVREAGKYKPDWIQENPLAEIRQDLYKRPAILSKESTTDMVQNAKSFKELILIAEENPIRGTYNVFNNNLLERSLNDVLYGKTPIMQITRSNGLRDKAIALFREEGYSFDANGYIFLDDFIDEAAARTDSFEIIKGIANGFSG